MKLNGLAFAAAVLLLSNQGIAQVGNNETVGNANLMSAEELLSLPMVSSDIADAIREGRPYLDASQLDASLSGVVGDEARAQLYRHMFRPINLNDASREEIMLIPGMSRKMAHEFEEYRPYSSLEQFRREIGKYVDEEEVARLETYVFIPMNLNSASSEDFSTIPGMSRKMVHEFEEYRPYSSLDQFRREIGKYVDEDEVARLESYITLE